jgi:NCAIR mutase (PurE)-related protein
MSDSTTPFNNESDRLAFLGDYCQLDLGRQHRRGISEAVYGPGKSVDQVVEIATRLADEGQTVLCTRLDDAQMGALAEALPDCIVDRIARCVYRTAPEKTVAEKRLGEIPGTSHVLVVCAGTTDLPVAREARCCLEAWRVPNKMITDVGVAGLHRLLRAMPTLTEATVILTVAGMEATLPTAVAGLVKAPVIGIPTSVGYGANLGGIAALLSMLNSCAGGLTVVNIDNGFGAALASTLILHRMADASESVRLAISNPEGTHR